MDTHHQPPLKIAIVGAGFSGTALTAHLQQGANRPIDVYLFEKTGDFGRGAAYRTPYYFHLLNVPVEEMSALEGAPKHFLTWLNSYLTTTYQTRIMSHQQPLAEQYVPRFLYGHYLQSLLKEIQAHTSKIRLHLEAAEVIALHPQNNRILLSLQDGRQIDVDKVVLALGNHAPPSLPFPIPSTINAIHNGWHYNAVEWIPPDEAVLILGTGLSMVDTVLSLYHQQHRGKIYAVSRRGLLPLPHAQKKISAITLKVGPCSLRHLLKSIRHLCTSLQITNGDWRSVIASLRTSSSLRWTQGSLEDKQRFLRHLLPYWNIHRHRVPNQISALLRKLLAKTQLQLIAGRLIGLENSNALIKVRSTQQIQTVSIKWIINCMGPSTQWTATQTPLIHFLLTHNLAKLDALKLGLSTDASGAIKNSLDQPSSLIYALGPLRKGSLFESSAVPEIRQQCFNLAHTLMANI